MAHQYGKYYYEKNTFIFKNWYFLIQQNNTFPRKKLLFFLFTKIMLPSFLEFNTYFKKNIFQVELLLSWKM